jgi:hypothetical protein
VLLAGIITLNISILPMMFDPECTKKMYSVLFSTTYRGYIHPAPTFWSFISGYMVTVDQEEARLSPLVSVVIQLICAILLFYFLQYNVSKTHFLKAYIIFGATAYIFGYSIHEKHIHYMLIGMLLIMAKYKEYLTIIIAINCASVFPHACMQKNNFTYLFYGIFMTGVAYLFEQ